MIIRWVGGTGRYQLQRALQLGNDWQDEAGVVTTNSVTITRSNSSAFYRVIALPQ